MIRQAVQKIRNNEFVKNVLIVASGTALSQVILMIASPFLTRIFPPEAFGVQALFTSITTILGCIAMWKLEQAILLPTETVETFDVIRLAIVIGIIMMSLYLFVVVVINFTPLFELFRVKYKPWLWAVPFTIFSIGLWSCFSIWSQTNGDYKNISKLLALQSIVSVVLNLLSASFGILNSGLIIGLVGGQLVSLLVLIYILRKTEFIQSLNQRWAMNHLIATLRRFQNFPKYFMWSQLLNITAQQMIPVVFNFLYTTKEVGLFSLANRILKLPLIIFSTSIQGVFRVEAARQYAKNGECAQLFDSTLQRLIYLGVAPFILLAVLSPVLFGVIFGSQWQTAGIYSSILSVGLFFDYVSMPLNAMYVVAERQRLNLFMQSLNTIGTLVALLGGYYLYHSIIISILFYTVFSALYNCYSIIVCKKISKRSTHSKL